MTEVPSNFRGGFLVSYRHLNHLNPLGRTLGCVLWHREEFDLQTLKKKRLIFLYNEAWWVYRMPDQEVRLLNGTIL